MERKGHHVDGRVLEYDEVGGAFYLAGSPVAIDYVRACDRAGQCVWDNKETEDWFRSLPVGKDAATAGSGIPFKVKAVIAVLAATVVVLVFVVIGALGSNADAASVADAGSTDTVAEDTNAPAAEVSESGGEETENAVDAADAAALEASQEVAIVKVDRFKDSIDTPLVTVTARNNTKKRVKSYTFSFIAWDKDNLPVKVGINTSDWVGEAQQDQNILPGKTMKAEGGWYLGDAAVNTVKACVKSVEYYEGGTWENPYYQIWYDKYVEKPLE